MRVKLKRVLSFVSAVVICGVSCVTSWFSVPVSAIGVFSPFNFYQLYQMLHGLLLGDGGGNSQTFGEWLEKNMTQTIGSGNDKHVFLLTPGEKLEDMMSEASIRLALGAACTDGGIAGASKIKDLIDSWAEVYDASDIGEIGSGSSGGSLSGWSTSNFFKIASDFDFTSPSGGCRFVFNVLNSDSGHEPIIVYYCKDGVNYLGLFYYVNSRYIMAPGFYQPPNNFSTGCFVDSLGKNVFTASDFGYSQSMFPSGRHNFGIDSFCLWSDVIALSRYLGIYSESPIPYSDIVNLINSNKLDWQPYISESFVGPVYAMPAAKQLITGTGTLSGLRLDVQTEDGTPDISAALNHAGVESVDDLVSGVAAGTIPMSQVYEDMRIVPYVLTDVETGQVVTDLNVSATDAKTKAVALDKTLSIPKDVSAADAYQVTGKTWDPDMSKYKLPLFQFFPFCLPWDIYEVLTLFDAEPVAPKFTIPVGQFFTRFSGSVDTSKAADQKAVVDLGSDSWQSTFKVIRALECAAIIIGLCLTAVLLIHGGR